MIRLHNMNRTHTFIDVESGQFISLPKDETDKPPVNADINGLQFFDKSTQDGEPTPDIPVPITSPTEWDMVSAGRNLWVNEALPKTKSGVTLSYDEETGTYTLNGNSEVWSGNFYFTASTYKFYAPIRNGEKYHIKTEIVSGTISNSENIRYLTAFISANFNGNWFATSLLESSTWSKNATEDGFVSNFRIYCTFLGAVTFNDYKFKIHFEESKTAPTTIEKYTGNTYPYRLEDLDGTLHELCSLPDGTADIFNSETYELVKRTKTVVLNGSESGWTGQNIPAVNRKQRFNLPMPDCVFDIYDLPIMLSDKFKGVRDIDMWGNTNYDHCVSGHYTVRYISLSSVITADMTLAEFKTWLSQNPVTVQYKLATPITYQIKQYGKTYGGVVWEYNEKPKSIQYHTNIFTDKNIDMQCEVRKLGNRKMSEFYWVTENGDKIITEDEDYIMFEY